MKARPEPLVPRLRPSQVIDDLFRVCGIDKQIGHDGRARFSVVSIDGTGQFDAIGGKQARRLAVGQIVRLRGCVLVRRGGLILVVRNLHPHSKG